MTYTKQQLENIKKTAGMPELRKIGDEFGVKAIGMDEMIGKIMEAQGPVKAEQPTASPLAPPNPAAMSSIEEAKKSLEKTLGKAKILIYMKTISIIHSSIFRKTTADKIKAVAEKPGYKKAAIFGPSVTLRTITNFIITASGVKNMRIFNSKKEALRWLKES